MDVSSTTSTTGSTSSSSSTSSLSNLSENFDTFLTLLTTQLQYQDPLSPMDSSEFTNQLVQYANVEQAIHQNKNLESLIALQETSNMVDAIGFIGKDVEVTGQTARLENGNAEFKYTMPEDAAAAIVAIYDENGTQVYYGKAETSAGAHTLVWNGTNNKGETLEDGNYTIQIAAANADGDQITPTFTVHGLVTAVGMESGSPLLDLNGLKVPLANVVRVIEPEGETG